MFEVFPIINLYDQQHALNCAIKKHNLTRKDVLSWLQYYGTLELLLYPERTAITPQYTDYVVNLIVDKPKHLFVFKQTFGDFDVFNFVQDSSEIDVMGRGWIRSFIY